MSDSKQPKWDSGATLSKGKQSLNLFKTYETELKPRIPEAEITQHTANVAEFEKRRSGQEPILANQKSYTSAQNDAVSKVNMRVSSLRKVVNGANAPAEIKIAYGVGGKNRPTVIMASSAAQTVLSAYKLYKDWSNRNGILDKDIAELTTLEAALFTSDDKQIKSIFERKAATMDKNTLQRSVEDMVTRISGLGVHEFELTNPPVAKLFADLIPSAPPKKDSKKAKPATV